MRAVALAGRYARALLLSAEDKGETERVLAELAAFAKVLETEPRLRLVLFSPEVERDRKEALVKDLLSGQVSELFLRFLLVLIKANRQNLLPEILGQYEQLLDQRLGRVRARTTTAVPLPDDLREQLRQALARALDAQVELSTDVDPEILGGLVVRVDGKVYDASVRHRLEMMRETLLKSELPAEQNQG